MILDLYAQDIESGIQRQLVNPDPPPPIPFELWSFTGAGAKGVPKGLTELGANALDAVAGVTEIGSDSLPPEKQQRAKERSDAIRTMGESVRAKAKDFTVDPETSHQADVVINNLSSTVTQAVASVAVAGVGAGSLVFGASTGYQTYMDLLKKGVDKSTAMKVAGVTGVVNAAGVVVPIGAATKLGTAGLVALSGPGAYMLQEKVSKDILQHAGYEKEALTHDPFDPLGLTISTVLPGVFGAAHAARLSRVPTLEDVVKHIESGGRRYGKDGQLLTSPKGAQGEMQVMPYTASDPGFGVVPARDSSPEELARVGRDYLDAMVKRYGDRDKALAAYNAGPGAVDNAIKEAGDGWLSRMPAETQKYVGKANRMLGDAVAQRATPEAVDAARVRVADEALMKSMPDHPEAVSRVASAADEVAAGRVPDVEEPMVTVWHGSPHKFDVFDSTKIGTGEGAQAYGHGLYLAESEGTARFYQEALSRATDPAGSIRVSAQQDIVKSWIDASGGDRARAASEFERFAKDSGLEADQTAEMLEAIRSAPGFIYKAKVPQSAVDKMLDWDRPLSEQPSILAALRESDIPAIGAKGVGWRGAPDGMWERAMSSPSRTGEWLYREIAGNEPNATSEALRNLGVPGVKYLDGASRRAGDGTRNFVIFPGEEGLLRIAERNGEPMRAPNTKLPPESSVSIEPETAPAQPADSLDTERIQTLIKQNPDLPVKLPGTDETMTLKAALQRYIDEADIEMKQADLVKAAVECALGG